MGEGVAVLARGMLEEHACCDTQHTSPRVADSNIPTADAQREIHGRERTWSVHFSSDGAFSSKVITSGWIALDSSPPILQVVCRDNRGTDKFNEIVGKNRKPYTGTSFQRRLLKSARSCVVAWRMPTAPRKSGPALSASCISKYSQT
jgi:hypothetical protein